ncbi:hypothetical protein OROGR_001159 [Orobanche gracilis]
MDIISQLQEQVNTIAALAFNTFGTLQRDAPPVQLSPNYPEPPPPNGNGVEDAANISEQPKLLSAELVKAAKQPYPTATIHHHINIDLSHPTASPPSSRHHHITDLAAPPHPPTSANNDDTSRPISPSITTALTHRSTAFDALVAALPLSEAGEEAQLKRIAELQAENDAIGQELQKQLEAAETELRQVEDLFNQAADNCLNLKKPD